MAKIVDTKMGLEPVDSRLVWKAHDASVINEDVDFRQIGEGACSFCKLSQRREVELKGSSLYMRIDGLDGGNGLVDFGQVTAGEDEQCGGSGGEREGTSCAETVGGNTGYENLKGISVTGSGEGGIEWGKSSERTCLFFR